MTRLLAPLSKSNKRRVTAHPSFSQRSWGLIRLVHPFPVAIVVSASIAVLFVVHRGNPGLGLVLRAGGVVLTSQVLLGALNDLLDRDADARTQSRKPIPSGLVPIPAAWLVVAAGASALAALAVTFDAVSLGLIALGTATGLAYDVWLKPTPAGVLAYVLGFYILFTWLVWIAGTFSPELALIYVGTTLAAITAHLANSYPDLESDAHAGHRTVAMLVGPRWGFKAILAGYAILDAGGIVVASISRQVAALGLLACAGLIGGGAWLSCRDAPDRPGQRAKLFRLVALGLVLVAAGGLLAVFK